MTNNLFKEFNEISSKEWKNRIQYELDGEDYNSSLVWESLEGIKVRPFYHFDDAVTANPISTTSSEFKILQDIYVYDIDKSIYVAQYLLNKGAEILRFRIENIKIDTDQLLSPLALESTEIIISLAFINEAYINKINDLAIKRNANIWIQVDPINKFAKEGNWYSNLNNDFKILNTLQSSNLKISLISIDSSLYQNSGANIIQQIAYTLSHANEYWNRIEKNNQPFLVEVAIGGNYFFEIAKLRALRWLLQLVAEEYNHNSNFKILAYPSRRNKTIYNADINIIRTSMECSSAILGGADIIANLPYDSLYRKNNKLGNITAINQLLILKKEASFNKVNNPSEGSYYIEALTQQFAEKALELFKDIESNGGWITQLIEGTIQRKINESAKKEQDLFDNGKETLVGINKNINSKCKMAEQMELFPFVKNKPRKTLIKPLIERRLAEEIEKQWLNAENNK